MTLFPLWLENLSRVRKCFDGRALSLARTCKLILLKKLFWWPCIIACILTDNFYLNKLSGMSVEEIKIYHYILILFLLYIVRHLRQSIACIAMLFLNHILCLFIYSRSCWYKQPGFYIFLDHNYCSYGNPKTYKINVCLSIPFVTQNQSNKNDFKLSFIYSIRGLFVWLKHCQRVRYFYRMSL